MLSQRVCCVDLVVNTPGTGVRFPTGPQWAVMFQGSAMLICNECGWVQFPYCPHWLFRLEVGHLIFSQVRWERYPQQLQFTLTAWAVARLQILHCSVRIRVGVHGEDSGSIPLRFGVRLVVGTSPSLSMCRWRHASFPNWIVGFKSLALHKDL
jgi:hypothetical protein